MCFPNLVGAVWGNRFILDPAVLIVSYNIKPDKAKKEGQIRPDEGGHFVTFGP
jgi:hypothetical protein